jgi:hypothetical protein
MKLLIMQSSPASCHFLPLRWFSDTLNLCSFFSVRETKFHTNTKQEVKSYFVYFSLHAFSEETERQKPLKWMVVGIPRNTCSNFMPLRSINDDKYFSGLG